jgi:transposase InsO family protein
MDELKRMYYDPETGFLSAPKLYQKLKEKGIKITLEKVKEFVNKQYSSQISKPVKRPKMFNSIVSPGPKNNYQLDIIVYDRWAYHGYRYILCLIDVYSRYVSAIPMTNRRMETIVSVVRKLFDTMRSPKNINSDLEFNKKEFIKLLTEYKVKPWFSQVDDYQKNAIVERFNRTLAHTLNVWRKATKSYDWPKVLPKIISSYNNTLHSTIKAKPFDVFKGNDENKQTIVKLKMNFKVGDKVRVRKNKKIFQKGDVSTHSKTLYVIDAISKNRYLLRNPKSGAKLRRKVRDYEISKFDSVEKIKYS